MTQFNAVANVQSFDREMWYGFAGCSRFNGSAGEAPVYVELNGWLIIADGEATQCHSGEDTDECPLVCYDFNIQFPNACCAIAFLIGLAASDDFNPEQFNAQRIL